MTCPACERTKRRGQYLCRGCWFSLQPAARRALSRHDQRAAVRLLELHQQIADGVPLHQVEVTP